MANLAQTSRPYLHMSSATFINNVAKMYKTDSQKTRVPLDTKTLEALKEKAVAIEKSFYNDFGVTNAEQWSDQYLARDQGDIAQVALSVWNSHIMRNKLYGEISLDKLLEKTDSKLGTTVKEKLQTVVLQSPTLEQALTTVISEELLSLLDSPQKQKEFRSKITGESTKQMRRIVTGSTVIPKLVESLLFENINGAEIEKRKNDCFSFFKKLLFKNLKERGIDITPKNETLMSVLESYKILLNDTELFSKKKNDITGIVEEKGDEITLRLLLQERGENFKIKSTPDMKVKRIGVSQLVKTKIDMIIQGKNKTYRIQQKNTDKDIFSEFEQIGQKELQNHSLFFTAHGDISFDAFRKQVEKVFGQSSSPYASLNSETPYLDLLEYLLVNINVLNQGYSETKGGKFYKKQPNKNIGGTYSKLVMKLFSDIVSKYCLLFFSDIEKELKNLLLLKRYDFIIFNSRILIPMSIIYDNIITNLKDTSNKINKEVGYLDENTTFKKGRTYSQEEYLKMVDKKKAAVGQFDPTKDYENQNLVNVGKNEGANVLQRIKLGSFVPNINLASLVPNKVRR